jgi:hypothetical protein
MVSKIRKQIYIEAQQDNLLKESARRTGLSEAEIIRQAIDRHVSSVTSPTADLIARENEKAFLANLENQNLLPRLQDLSRDEKLQLIKLLVRDLETSEIDSDRVLLSRLAGTWTEADETQFLQNTEAFREIEESLWT